MQPKGREICVLMVPRISLLTCAFFRELTRVLHTLSDVPIQKLFFAESSKSSILSKRRKTSSKLLRIAQKHQHVFSLKSLKSRVCATTRTKEKKNIYHIDSSAENYIFQKLFRREPYPTSSQPFLFRFANLNVWFCFQFVAPLALVRRIRHLSWVLLVFDMITHNSWLILCFW